LNEFVVYILAKGII